MRNIIFGVIGVLWGGAIVLKGMPRVDNAYGMGQMLAFVFGFLMLGAGAWALQRGIRNRRTA